MGQSAQKPSFTPFGTAFQPIGYINGKPVWPVIGGADGDGDEGSSGTGDDGDAGDGNDQGNAAAGSDGTGDSSESGKAGGSEETVSKAEFEALKRRMQAADQRASNAETKVKDFEDKDKSDLEKANNRVEELEKRDRERDADFKALQMRDAFRDASDAEELSWHNSGLAMKELKQDLITVEDDGTVKGMVNAIKALAKDHPYLVKPKDDDDNNEGQASGGSFGGKQGGKKVVDDKNKMSAKYPALRGRGGN